jgi:hypothetical protein
MTPATKNLTAGAGESAANSDSIGVDTMAPAIG